jgi:hypothetical protein
MPVTARKTENITRCILDKHNGKGESYKGKSGDLPSSSAEVPRTVFSPKEAPQLSTYLILTLRYILDLFYPPKHAAVGRIRQRAVKVERHSIPSIPNRSLVGQELRRTKASFLLCAPFQQSRRSSINRTYPNYPPYPAHGTILLAIRTKIL